MTNRSGRTVRLISCVVLVACSAWVGQANADALKSGDYAFSGGATCLVSPGGFDTDFTPITPPGLVGVNSFSIEGVRTFNGDGTGKIVARIVNFGFVPDGGGLGTAHGRVNSSDVEADFTYTVAPDLTITVEHATVNLTFLRGTIPGASPGSSVPALGQTATITGFPPLFGSISQDYRSLTLATSEPRVETVTTSTGNVTKRVCQWSTNLFERKGRR